MFYEAELSAKILWAPWNGHFALSVGPNLLDETEPKTKNRAQMYNKEGQKSSKVLLHNIWKSL
jgi:YD repeat-containing protein